MSLDCNSGDEYKEKSNNPNDPKVVKIYRKNKFNSITAGSQ